MAAWLITSFQAHFISEKTKDNVHAELEGVNITKLVVKAEQQEVTPVDDAPDWDSKSDEEWAIAESEGTEGRAKK